MLDVFYLTNLGLWHCTFIVYIRMVGIDDDFTGWDAGSIVIAAVMALTSWEQQRSHD